MRMIDANINRICEGLRVCEDLLRFEYDNDNYSKQLKEARHAVRKAFSGVEKSINSPEIIPRNSRNSADDNGRHYQVIESDRAGMRDLFSANILRAEEGLRVLEESCKVVPEFLELVPIMKETRFKVYEIEKAVMNTFFGVGVHLAKIYSMALEPGDKNLDVKQLTGLIEENGAGLILDFDLVSVQVASIVIENILEQREGPGTLFLLFKNRLDLALLFPGNGLFVTGDYFDIFRIRKKYSGYLGVSVENSSVTPDGVNLVVVDKDSVKTISTNAALFLHNTIVEIPKDRIL
jgi:hypothetical protein